MKRRFVIVDSDGDADRDQPGPVPVQVQDHGQVSGIQQQLELHQEHHDDEQQEQTGGDYETSRAQIGYWLNTGRSPALYTIDTDSNSNSHSIGNTGTASPPSLAATSDDLFLPRPRHRYLALSLALPTADASIPGPSNSHAQTQTRNRDSDSDSSVLTAKYIRSVRNEMPTKGVSSKRRRKSKVLKENPTFFAKGPAELDPDERLSRLRKSISLIGPIKFSNHLKEYNRNASRHNESFSRSRYDQTLPEEQNTFEQLYSEDSGINLTENYSNYSTVDVSRTEIREVRIYRQTRTDVYHQSPRNLFRC